MIKIKKSVTLVVNHYLQPKQLDLRVLSYTIVYDSLINVHKHMSIYTCCNRYTSSMRIILLHSFFWFPNIVLTVFCCAFFVVHLLGSISSRSFVSDCRFCIQSSFFCVSRSSVFGSIEFNFDRSLILCFFLKFD